MTAKSGSALPFQIISHHPPSVLTSGHTGLLSVPGSCHALSQTLKTLLFFPFTWNIFLCSLILFKTLFTFVCDGELRFLTLAKSPSVGDFLCITAVQSPLTTKAQGPAGSTAGSDQCLQTQTQFSGCSTILFLSLVTAP